MQAYLGEIRMFAGKFAPQNWMFCDGGLLNIGDYGDLHNLLGTAWGGDGVTTFARPDLRGRVPIGQGAGQGLTARTTGQVGGFSKVAITQSELPAHSHAFNVSNASATSPKVTAGAGLAQPPTPASGKTVRYGPGGAVPKPTMDAMSNAMMAPSPGKGLPHSNLMPSLAIHYIICTSGLYPA